MSIAGLILLDSLNKPIIQSAFRPPTLSNLYVSAFTTALQKSHQSPSSDLESILWVEGAGENGGGAVCVHLEVGGMRLLSGVSREANPLLALTFMDTFLYVLEEYLGEISEASLKENFDVVYQLMEEILDEGYPLTTESNLLRDIVTPPSILNKVLNVAGLNAPGPSQPPFSTAIPWRRPNVRYSNNEIFFDMVEKHELVQDKRGNVIHSNQYGKMKCNSRLSGTPDINLTFTNPKAILDPGFHPCIRYSKWTQSKLLSFVPPDGQFTLMDYRTESNLSSISASSVSSAQKSKQDVSIKLKVKLSDDGGRFDITILPLVSGRPVENVTLLWHLGKDCQNVSATTNPGMEVDCGRWEWDNTNKNLKWTLPPVLPSGSGPRSLTGSFTTSEIGPNPSPSLQVKYTVHQYTLSNLKIDKLKVIGAGSGPGGAAVKIFRGVRGRVEGSVEVRW